MSPSSIQLHYPLLPHVFATDIVMCIYDASTPPLYKHFFLSEKKDVSTPYTTCRRVYAHWMESHYYNKINAD